MKAEKKFRFQAYRTLLKRLGEYDAIVELNELAVRKFLDEIDGNEESAISSASKLYGIRIDFDSKFDHTEFTARRSQFYVLSVYQQAEVFFDELLDDVPAGFAWKTSGGSDARRDDEAQLSWILRMIKKHVKKKIPSSLLQKVEVYDYFRLVRNAFMHEGKETKQVVKSREDIARMIAEIDIEIKSGDQTAKKIVVDSAEGEKKDRKEIALVLPNSYGHLNFSDFIYFTRIVKDIAEILCILLRPGLDELLKHTFSEGKHHGLKQYMANSQRFDRACANFLERKFNLDSSDIQYAIPVIRKLL